MPDENYLQRLREYYNYLESVYKRCEEIRDGESMRGSIAAGCRLEAHSDDRKKLEELFPELKSEGEK